MWFSQLFASRQELKKGKSPFAFLPGQLIQQVQTMLA
jgi:hypothetical protein